eukprot:gene113-27_t
MGKNKNNGSSPSASSGVVPRMGIRAPEVTRSDVVECSKVRFDLPQFSGDRSKLSFADWAFKAQAEAAAKGLSWGDLPSKDDIILSKFKSDIIAKLTGEALEVAKAASETSCKGLIDALSKRFGSSSAASRMLSLKELLSSKLNAGEKITSYISRKNKILREDLNNSIDIKEIHLMSVLSNLPAEYNQVATSLMVKRVDQIQLDSVWNLLKEHQVVLDGNQANESESAVLQTKADKAVLKSLKKKKKQARALALKGNNYKGNQKGAGKGGKGKGGKGIKGAYKGQPKSHPHSGHLNAPPSSRACWSCNQPGHEAWQCPNKQPQAYQTVPAQYVVWNQGVHDNNQTQANAVVIGQAQHQGNQVYGPVSANRMVSQMNYHPYQQ